MCGFDCPNRLYLNRPEGGGRVLVESANDLGVDFIGAIIVGTFADYDRDGDLDLFLVTNRLPAPDSLLNEPFSLSHDWLNSDLRARAPSKDGWDRYYDFWYAQKPLLQTNRVF